MSAADAAAKTVEVATIGPCTRLLWALFTVATDGAYAAAAGPLSAATAAVDRLLAAAAGPTAAAAAALAGWVMAAAAAATRWAYRACAYAGRAVAVAAATPSGARLGAAAARLSREWLPGVELDAVPLRQAWAVVRGDPATQLLGTCADAPNRREGGRPPAHGRRALRRGGAGPTRSRRVASAAYWLLPGVQTPGLTGALPHFVLVSRSPALFFFFSSGEGCGTLFAMHALLLAAQSSAASSACTCC